MQRAIGRWLFVSLGLLGIVESVLVSQGGPTFAIRERVLKSLVYVRATGCPDPANGTRAGSGFALNNAGTIVTAHHVIGGCQAVTVTYEGLPPSTSRTSAAVVARVLSAGDLALLSVDKPPDVPVLVRAQQPNDKSATYAGFGFQNGQPTAGNQPVTFSTGSSYLRDILPREAANELRQTGSRIDVNREVLRFNVALQPGMSGGPIVDTAGRVVGIIAGGLRAGAAPASWGWPVDWVETLQSSTEARDVPVLFARAYYSLNEMMATAEAAKTGRNITCGTMTLTYHGRWSFQDVARGSDDEVRLRYVMAISTLPTSTIERMYFDTWVHDPSGATVVTPSGYRVELSGDVCELRSSSGPFRQVIWGVSAQDATEVQRVSLQFEQSVMYPRAPYQFGFQFDPSLTTAGPQFKDNGLVFNRKGFLQAKQPFVPGTPQAPLAHTFETLIAKNRWFVGIGTLNEDVPPGLPLCSQSGGKMPGCDGMIRHLEEWTRFILATQLSTYPST